jgi:hypothetical protein
MGVASLVFVIHVYCYLIVGSDPFFNNMFVLIDKSSVSFASIPVLILIGYYLLLAAHKGQIKMGMRLMLVKFYPILPKETFVNAFFANCIVLNVYSVAVTQLAVQCFAAYLVNTSAAKIWLVQASNMMWVSWLY